MAKEYVEQRKDGYYVAGTRVSLDSIIHCFREGLSPETILQEFETLTPGQVYGAIAFYLDNQLRIRFPLNCASAWHQRARSFAQSERIAGSLPGGDCRLSSPR